MCSGIDAEPPCAGGSEHVWGRCVMFHSLESRARGWYRLHTFCQACNVMRVEIKDEDGHVVTSYER